MPRKDLILSLYEGEQHIGRRHCNQRHPSSREGCPWLQWRLPMCSIGSIRLASSLSSLCECTAFASCCMSSNSLRGARVARPSISLEPGDLSVACHASLHSCASAEQCAVHSNSVRVCFHYIILASKTKWISLAPASAVFWQYSFVTVASDGYFLDSRAFRRSPERGGVACSGVASSNSWRLSVTSATSLAEMLVLMAPVATHGSYGTYRALTASVVRATCAGPWHSSLSMAFCVQRSPQNSSLAEEEQFTDIRPARRPRLHLVPCANMAHFSTSFCDGPRMVIGGIVQHGHTDAKSGPLARAHPSRWASWPRRLVRGVLAVLFRHRCIGRVFLGTLLSAARLARSPRRRPG